MAKQKYSEEFVRKFLNDIGCELLSEYKGVKERFKYRCSCGENANGVFDAFINKKQKGCNKCSGKRANEKISLKYEFVKSYFEEQGCTLLETEYINSKTKMRYICICGREDFKKWNHFKKGQRCKKCAIENKKEDEKFSFEEVNNFLVTCGYQLLDTYYVNIHTPMNCLCSCGNKIEKSLAVIKASPKCTCNSPYNSVANRKKNKYTDEDLIEYFWKYVDEFSRYPTSSDFRNNKKYPSQTSYSRRWGSFKNFLVSMGVMSENGWYIEDEKVLNDYYQYNDIGLINEMLLIKRSESTIRHHAHTMGLKVNHESKFGIKKLSREEIINQIQLFVEEFGHTPTLNEMIDYKEIAYSQIRSEFGSWNDALRYAEVSLLKDYRKLNEEEIELLIKMYEDRIPSNKIAEYFGYKNSASIIPYLNRNGVKLKNNRWTNEDIIYLKNNYPNEPLIEIIDHLKRFSLEDIFNKASKLGIKRKNGRNIGKVEKYTASDGTECLSFSEYQVTEILIHNDIKFNKEVFYKDIFKDDNLGRLRSDWVILNGEVVVEYFGMSGFDSYQEKMKRKQLTCLKYNKPMISLYFYDLRNNFKGLIKKFKDLGITINIEKLMILDKAI